MKIKLIKLISSLIGFFIAQAVLAKADTHIIVDVYKSKQITADLITKKFSKQLHTIAEFALNSEGQQDKKNQEKFIAAMTSTIVGINKLGQFAYVGISPIRYPEDTSIYLTIDLVDKKDKQRIPTFIKSKKMDLPDPYHLISAWQEYEKRGSELALNKRISTHFKTCPALHCLFGFEDPALHNYLAIFDGQVPKAKTQLIRILKNDKEAHKRAIAAYLLAHIKDADELVNILAPSMLDSSGEVRNNVMRVIAEAVTQAKNTHGVLEKAVSALDFPLTTDRNKALFIISCLANRPHSASYIIHHASTQLLEELELAQLNVHSLSYQILQRISGEKFGDRDYQAWRNWLKEHQSLAAEAV